MPNVGFVRKEVKEMLPIYELVDDCCDGEFKVKNKKDVYLPRPNATDTSKENIARYDAYLKRAIFYNVTGATFSGLIGQIFKKDPEIQVSSELEFMLKDCDGTGKGLLQYSKEACGFLVKNSRFGLLSDYPKSKSEKGFSIEEIEMLKIRPSLKLYASKDIINWRTKVIGAEIVYNLIVLKEKYVSKDDGFEFEEDYQYRVLRLSEDNIYYQELYKGPKNNYEKVDSFIPKDYNGNNFNRIPFEFCGTYNNDAEPDIPVLYDIANLNIGHYRNSADYEESCFIVGQPTPYVSGLTEEWVKKVLKGSIQLGSRAAIPLPVDGQAGLIQAQANTMPMEAMRHKEEQFLALGAKLVSADKTQRTASEAKIDNSTETSILASFANNCSEAFTKAIDNCMKFVSPNDFDTVFKLNTDFEISKMSTAERNQLLNEWMKGAITWEEYRMNLRQGKVLLIEDNEANIQLQEEIDEDLNNQIKANEALNNNQS